MHSLFFPQYLDVIGALGSLVEMKELSGMQPLQHLPQERRAEVGLQRKKALELLYKKIRNLQLHLERKEKMLKDFEGSMEQLRYGSQGSEQDLVLGCQVTGSLGQGVM